MRRREFLKHSGLGAGSLLAGSSLASFLVSCTKMNMMNMNMSGQPQPVTEGDFTRLLPIPNIVTANTTLNAQATSANINGSTISVLGYQANGILGPTIRAESGLNTNINFQNSLSENSNIHFHGLKIPADMDGHPKYIINPANSIKDDIMPLNSYKIMHKSAQLSSEDKSLIINWAHQSIVKLLLSN